MSEPQTSYRQILRSSSIVGGASVATILLGLARNKVVAVLLGPAGIGLIGLYTSIMGTFATIASLGLGASGTRQIAEATAQADPRRAAIARRALFWGTLLLGAIGALSLWFFRGPVSRAVFGSDAEANAVGWLAIGVALSVVGTSQAALLNGMRRIGDLARVSVYGGALSTLAGVAAVLLWGRDGLLPYVLASPLASVVFGCLYAARLPRLGSIRTSLRELGAHWKVLVSVGFALMAAGFVGTAAQLGVRIIVQRELGDASLGYFQAAWTISMNYIGFVLAAMSTDYFPRLTRVIRDHEEANRLVNQQTEVALLLAGPVLLAVLALAPWVITWLYSESFGPAAEVLRWQILGDILKVASWPLGFVILASGDGRTFFLTESVSFAIFTAAVWALLPWCGIAATGVSFVLIYIVYLPWVFLLARGRTGFRWTVANGRLLGVLAAAALVLLAVSFGSASAAAFVGVPIALLAAVLSLSRLSQITGLGGPLGKISVLAGKLLRGRGSKRGGPGTDG